MITIRTKCLPLVVLVGLAIGSTANANLYQWTDAQGIRHFSNVPPPDDIGTTAVSEEIPFDPEQDAKRRVYEDALLKEREAAQLQKRLEEAERAAEEAQRQAETARRKVDRLEAELEAREEDHYARRYYPVIWRACKSKKWCPPGRKHPGRHPKPEPYSWKPEKRWRQAQRPKPWQQPSRPKPWQRQGRLLN